MKTKYNPKVHLTITFLSILLGFILTSNINNLWLRFILTLVVPSIFLSIYYYHLMVKERRSLSVMLVNLLLLPIYFIANMFLVIPLIFYNIYRILRSIPSSLEEKNDKEEIKAYLKLKVPSEIINNDLLNCYTYYVREIAREFLYHEINLRTNIESLNEAEDKEVKDYIKNDEVMTYYNLTNQTMDIVKKYYTHSGILKKL